ncbi:hypothetical protein AAFC00_001555 [Neodothiora populina]|uniref:Uncharacterized protein n=1 Tax=Neodothiora populina TaxID=2781224 RepID=A0ABR3PPA0_9PEZI
MGLATENICWLLSPHGIQPLHVRCSIRIIDGNVPWRYTGEDLGGTALQTTSPAAATMQYRIYGAVEVKDYAKFFSRRFWTVDPPTRGLDAFAIPWRVTVRTLANQSMLPGEWLDPSKKPKEPIVPTAKELEAAGFKVKMFIYESSSDDGEYGDGIAVDDDDQIKNEVLVF